MVSKALETSVELMWSMSVHPVKTTLSLKNVELKLY